MWTLPISWPNSLYHYTYEIKLQQSLPYPLSNVFIQKSGSSQDTYDLKIILDDFSVYPGHFNPTPLLLILVSAKM